MSRGPWLSSLRRQVPNPWVLAAAFLVGLVLGAETLLVASTMKDDDRPKLVLDTSMDRPAQRPPTPTPTSTPGHRPPITTYFVPPDADASVGAALADGLVTREEYAHAVANNMACMDEKGVEHSAPVYQESIHQYHYTMAHTGPVPYEGLSPADECYMRFEQDIHGAWVRQEQR